MALEDYRKKRDFSATPEPPPEAGSSLAGDLFVVQKHAARALHYDVRLEMGGVLKSWAVPKGPSLDPDEKHLAVRVEDHPLDYADFEGVIPRGEYGGGTVMVWDRGRWFPDGESAADPEKALRDGRLKVRLEGTKLRGRWMFVRMRRRPEERGDKENWLFFKERDAEARSGEAAQITTLWPESARSGRSLEEIAAAAVAADLRGDEQAEPPRLVDPATIPGARRAPLPRSLEPELATLVSEAPAGDGWIHEIKFDGYRVMARLENGKATLFTRRGVDWTDHFPTLIGAVGELPARQAIFDGETVYLGSDGTTDFSRLAAALQSGTDPEARVVYFVFDLLYLDGYDLTKSPLVARKAALASLLGRGLPTSRVRYVDHVAGSGPEFFRQACGLALEGSIAKRGEAPYRPGRGRDWLKVKCLHRQEFVIGGFTERADAAGGVGALLLGAHDQPGGMLRYVGRVGTGWDDETMRALRARLNPLRHESSPLSDAPRGREATGVRWVRPDLVVEIEYLSWSGPGRLRHASFRGLRLDRPAAEVVLEEGAGGHEPDPVPALDPTPDGDPAPAGAGGHEPDPASALDLAADDEPAPDRLPAPAPVRTRAVKKSEPHEEVGGVVITNPERVMFPDTGLTKLDLARYYEDVAEHALPHLARRPLTIVRCPEGHTSECFFQKHAGESFPDTVIRVPIRDREKTADYMAVDSLAGLISLVQLGALEFHAWGSRIETLESPDRLCFDLDPDPELPFARVAEGARVLRGLLDGLGLESFVKTTGGKGLHVVVPLEPARSWDEVKSFAKGVVEAVVSADPERYVASMALKKRGGRIFIDYLRNGRGATFVAAFSTRRRAGAPVSTPLRWDELSSARQADRYTVDNFRRRLAGLRGDPWRGFLEARQSISDEVLQAVLSRAEAPKVSA
jgi:bifunctional non-homologous end joining protein LigD